MWSEVPGAVAGALAEVDDEGAEEFRRRAEVFSLELDELHDYSTRRIETIPEQQRVLVTAHDAFSYFGRAYGMEVRGLQGISTEAEAGTADVKDLVDFIVSRKIPAIFVESSVPQRNIQAVQEACSARDWQVRIGGELFSDSLGSEGSEEGTYKGMIRHNVETIVNALSDPEEAEDGNDAAEGNG